MRPTNNGGFTREQTAEAGIEPTTLRSWGEHATTAPRLHIFI